MKNLGRQLKIIRKGAGLTQRKVSNFAGFTSAQHVSNIERGLVVPSPNYITALCILTKVPPDSIVDSMVNIYRNKTYSDILRARKAYKNDCI